MAPGGVGIFLGQGMVEMSSIQVGAAGQDLAEMQSTAGREKFMKDQTREYFVLRKPPRPLALPLKGMEYHS